MQNTERTLPLASQVTVHKKIAEGAVRLNASPLQTVQIRFNMLFVISYGLFVLYVPEASQLFLAGHLPLGRNTL